MQLEIISSFKPKTYMLHQLLDIIKQNSIPSIYFLRWSNFDKSLEAALHKFIF